MLELFQTSDMELALINSCCDVKKEDTATVNLLGKMYPAEKKQKCQFCLTSFFPGAASKCEIVHDVNWSDFERKHVGFEEYGGMNWGKYEKKPEI